MEGTQEDNAPPPQDVDDDEVDAEDDTEDCDWEAESDRIETSNFVGEVMGIEVTDGKDSETYFAHKEVLQQHSPYFSALSAFKEGGENAVVFEDMKPRSFDMILQWMYSNTLREINVMDREEVLTQAWLAADRLMMEKCKNLLIDRLRVNAQDNSISTEIAASVVRQAGSAPCKLVECVVDQYIHDKVAYGSSDDWDNTSELKFLQTIEPSMALLITRKLLYEGRKWSNIILADEPEPTSPCDLKGCQYHDHAEGEECYLGAKDPPSDEN